MHTITSFILLSLAIFSWHVSADCSCNLGTGSKTGCQLYDPFFNGCCSRLQLQQDSSGRKSFTGFCPVPADVQTRYPNNTHLFSRLYLDECLAFNDTGKPHWITWNDKTNGVPNMYNFTEVCPSGTDVTGFLVGKDYVLGGKCKGGHWTLPGAFPTLFPHHTSLVTISPKTYPQAPASSSRSGHRTAPSAAGTTTRT
ncbi:hypothetical protein GE09DRAFT_496199 [Coniochaeta sp. 2T2.1]|nr:hypothetical protein GE09DRAFT_496199 [Coniochaeta sp. 2T2.1]